MRNVEHIAPDRPVSDYNADKYYQRVHLNRSNKLWMNIAAANMENNRVDSLSSLNNDTPTSDFVTFHRSCDTTYNSRDHSARDAPETIVYDYRRYIPATSRTTGERGAHAAGDHTSRHKGKGKGNGILNRSNGLDDTDMQLAILNGRKGHPHFNFYGDDPFDSSNEVITLKSPVNIDGRKHSKRRATTRAPSSDGSITSLDLNITRTKIMAIPDDLASTSTKKDSIHRIEEPTTFRRNIAAYMRGRVTALKLYIEDVRNSIKAALARLCTKRCKGNEPLMKSNKYRQKSDSRNDD